MCPTQDADSENEEGRLFHPQRRDLVVVSLPSLYATDESEDRNRAIISWLN
jgi:hypothetical protein